MRLSGIDLVCIRGGREVFSELGFALQSGEALLVTGPNGTGKSSLLRMIAGFVHVAGGKLELQDGDPELTLGEQTHYLGHQDAFKPALTVAENLVFWTHYLGGEQSSPQAALAAVGLDALAELPAAYLSAGQRRRLSIARLIAARRPIWLLDEPTSALDHVAQERLSELMARHLASGGLIIAAAHGPIGLAHARELRLGVAA